MIRKRRVALIKAIIYYWAKARKTLLRSIIRFFFF